MLTTKIYQEQVYFRSCSSEFVFNNEATVNIFSGKVFVFIFLIFLRIIGLKSNAIKLISLGSVNQYVRYFEQTSESSSF